MSKKLKIKNKLAGKRFTSSDAWDDWSVRHNMVELCVISLSLSPAYWSRESVPCQGPHDAEAKRASALTPVSVVFPQTNCARQRSSFCNVSHLSLAQFMHAPTIFEEVVRGHRRTFQARPILAVIETPESRPITKKKQLDQPAATWQRLKVHLELATVTKRPIFGGF